MGFEGREPVALYMALITPAVALFSALVLTLTEGQQGAVNAVAAALFGIVAAARVSVEKALPMLAGLVQALIALGLAFGLDLAPDVQAAILALTSAAVALFVRTQVVAPIPAPRMEVPRP